MDLPSDTSSTITYTQQQTVLRPAAAVLGHGSAPHQERRAGGSSPAGRGHQASAPTGPCPEQRCRVPSHRKSVHAAASQPQPLESLTPPSQGLGSTTGGRECGKPRPERPGEGGTHLPPPRRLRQLALGSCACARGVPGCEFAGDPRRRGLAGVRRGRSCQAAGTWERAVFPFPGLSPSPPLTEFHSLPRLE
ncbi:uncharacterized protein LOC144580772 [Callithrix jacchus]